MSGLEFTNFLVEKNGLICDIPKEWKDKQRRAWFDWNLLPRNGKYHHLHLLQLSNFTAKTKLGAMKSTQNKKTNLVIWDQRFSAAHGACILCLIKVWKQTNTPVSLFNCLLLITSFWTISNLNIAKIQNLENILTFLPMIILKEKKCCSILPCIEMRYSNCLPIFVI
jgi:hypothetical protein